MTALPKKVPSIDERRRRLSVGACPIHNWGMGQITGWGADTQRGYEDLGYENTRFTVVECGRRGCRIYGVTAGYEQPVALAPEWAFLLESLALDPASERWQRAEAASDVRSEQNRLADWTDLIARLTEYNTSGDGPPNERCADTIAWFEFARAETYPWVSQLGEASPWTHRRRRGRCELVALQ